MSGFRTRTLLAAGAFLAATLAPIACAPAGDRANLAPTLTLVATPVGPVAMQNGIAVPSFERQPRPTIDLGGEWRVEAGALDVALTLTERARSLTQIEEQAAGRHQPAFDDGEWATVTIPGPLNPPPERREGDAWLRRSFDVPADWAGASATLKFGAVNYVADVWLNGVHLGYHEGGHTPFAFDAGPHLRPGEANVLAVRVVNPPWGSRNDIVPWGLTDWWNFGGITRDVWLESSDSTHVVRADVVPHLDGADVGLVLANRGASAATVDVVVRVHPARVDDDNLLDPRPDALVPPDADAVASLELGPAAIEAGGIAPLEGSFAFRDPDWWSPAQPALYVLEVELARDGSVVDRLVESFGLRTIQVDAGRPGLVLNGAAVTFRGAALHDQQVVTSAAGPVTSRLPAPDGVVRQLEHAREVNADLIRAGHTPPNPVLLRLADRLGFAIWSEIPLYHYTPHTYRIALDRGIPQQMLREMALRDFNRPSVLFHGLSNESTGLDERREALAVLHEVDRGIDGTRLTGQAAYAFQPDDPTSAPLDVAGYTSYFGVFYGDDARDDTRRALDVMHNTHPEKPVMILEYGRWADGPDGERLQREIMERTTPAIDARDARRPRGFVSAAVWWSLEDYWTMRPGIEVEHFGLFEPSGRRRPAGDAAVALFGPREAGQGAELEIESAGFGRATAGPVRVSGLLLLRYATVGLVFSFAVLGMVLAFLVVTAPRRRA